MSKYRLRKEERMRVKARWKENLAMRAFYEFCDENSRVMNRLSFMPEEVFHASFVIIDSIKDSGDDWRRCVDELYDSLRAGIRGRLEVSKDELMLAVIEVIGVSVIMILQSDREKIPRADAICQSLMEKADIDGEKKNKYLMDMIDSIPKEINDEFFKYAVEYMNGEERISDQIAELLEDEESMDMLSEEVEDETNDKILATSIAIETFRKLREAKILDSHNMPVKGLSWAEKGILADAIAEYVGIEEKWDFFKKQWNVKNKETLRSGYNKGLKTNKGWKFKNKIGKIIK